MKKIREVNGRKVAFIERSDIKALIAGRDFIKKEILEEPSIVNMQCDSDGFYRIDDPSNVEYIARLGYILDYDTLTNLSKEEIHALADRAIEDRYKIDAIIEKLCEYKKKLTASEKKAFRKINYLDPRCADVLERNVLEASLQATIFSSLKHALIAQVRNYTNDLVRMSEQKDATEQPILPSIETKSKKF